jgi:predicted amidohydrolase YtcJ
MKNIVFFLSLFLISCSQTEKKQADLILKNGRFFTADDNFQQVTAVAISADTILALGSDTDIVRYAGDNTRIIDLNGAFAMPGFIEGHGHFLSLGESLQNLNLLHTSSWQQIVEMVKSKAASVQPGEWIEGRGWHQEKWNQDAGITVNGYPYHDALSAVTSDNPVVLYHASGHGLIANAAAMQLAGISRETPDPAGGRIVRDAKGNASRCF